MNPAAVTRQGDLPYHHGDLGEASLAAGYALVAEAGAQALSMRTVAARIGVTHRALYRHHVDREALLSAVAARGYEALAEALETAGSPPAFIEAYAGFALDEPEIYALMMARDRHAITGHPRLKAAAWRVIGLSEAILAQGQPAGPARRDRIVALWSLLHGALTLYRSGLLRAGSRAQFMVYLANLSAGLG